MPAAAFDLQALFPDGIPPDQQGDPFAVAVTDNPGQFKEAVQQLRKRLPVGDPAFRRLTQQQRERAFWVSGVAQADMVTDVLTGIDRAVREGTTLEDFRKDCLQGLVDSWGGEIPGRVATIFRTNVQTAYSAGRYQQLTDPVVRKARPYWQFRGVPDSRQSEICRVCNNVILPADDPWWSTHQPPLHYNCRSNITALAAREVDTEDLDDPPAAEAQDGFGAPPTHGVEPWRPDPDRYPPAVRDQLLRRMAEAHVGAPAHGAHDDSEATSWPSHGPQSRWGSDDADGDVQLQAAQPARTSPWTVEAMPVIPRITPKPRASAWAGAGW